MQIDDSLTLTPAEVQKLLRTGKNMTYKVIKDNDLAVRCGNRLLVPRTRLEAWLSGRGEEKK